MTTAAMFIYPHLSLFSYWYNHAHATTVVIGFLGTTLDAAAGRRPLGEMAADVFALPARGPARRSLRAAPRATPRHQPGGAACAPTSRRSRRRPRCACIRSRSARPLGFRGGLRRAARLRARPTPSTPSARTTCPHHHRHARRADLLVPADRGALLPGAPAADLAAAAGKRASAPGTYALIDLDLSRYDRIAARFAREQQESTGVPEVRHRHAQRRASTG